MDFLLKYKVRDLVRADSLYSELIYINTSTTIEETLSLLVSKNILSVPILDEKKKGYVGIIDLYQIMTFMAFSAYEPDREATLQDVIEKTDLSQPVVHLLGNTGLYENDEIFSLWNLPAEASIKEPLEYLGKGVYRILVTFEDSPTKMITQSDLMRFLHAHLSQLAPYKDYPLADSRSPNVHFLKAIHSVSSKSTALHAFQLMRLKQVNAVGIVDPATGDLLGSVSDEDLRGLAKENLGDFFLPVLEWQAKRGRAIVTVGPETTIEQAVNALVAGKLHRLWLVEGKKAIGVVSLTDIALFFYSHSLDLWYPSSEI